MRRGLELHQSGRGSEAAEFYSRAMQIDRDHPAANHLFGLVQLHQGHAEAAVRHIAIALEARPADPQYLANMGVALTNAGRNLEALGVLKRSVSLDPRFAEAYSNLGMTNRLLGRFDDAVSAYRQAAALKPGEAVFRYHLANALRLAGDPIEAESAYRAALELRPSYGQAYVRLAFMLIDQGRAAEALELLDQALVLLPHDAELHLQRSRALYALAKLDEAVAGFDQAIALRPTYGEAHLYRSTTVRHHKRDGSIDAMEELFRSESATVSDRIFAGFGLGKALADVGDHQGSVMTFVEANKMQRQRVPFSLADEVGYMRADVDRFRDVDDDPRIAGSGDAGPIFVVGLPRGGKSTLERILSVHPSLAASGELPTMGRLARQLVRDANGLPLSEISPARFAEMGRAYMREAERLAPPGKRVIDTMPSNYHHIGFIRMALPNARIVHCVRPRAEHCIAIFEKYLTGTGFEYSNDLDDLSAYFSAYRRMMGEWHSRFPGAICDVDVAGLRDGDWSATKRLLDFCGIEPDAANVSNVQSEPQYQEWSPERVAANRTEHLAAWRRVHPQLWD